MKRVKFLAFAAVLMMAAACSEPLEEAAEELSPQSEGAETPKKSHWGNKIEDPYSVSNMRLAFKELMKNSESSLSKAGVTEAQIKPTHLHLKFIPKNEEELDLLEADSVLDVVPIPFNYDLEDFDGVYRDPECPLGQPTYQYSVVKVGHKLPNVEYEVLDSLFFLDGSESQVNGISKNMSIHQFWNSLEYEALKLTNNLAGYEPVSLSKRYHPSGRVFFLCGTDSIPVPNAKIHVNFSTHSHSCYTNEDGSFYITGRFSGQVHFHVYFKNSYMNVFNCERPYEKYDAASYGGRSKGPCENFHIDTPLKKEYAITLKAGYDFSKSNIPITKNIGRIMKMCIYDDDSGDSSMKFNNDCNIAHIINYSKIYGKEKTESFKYKYIYAAATNAIGAIVLMNDGQGNHLVSQYNHKLQESWRFAVEFYLMRDVFGYYYQSASDANELVIDLIDNDYSACDKVSGFTLLDIEKQLKKLPNLQDDGTQWNVFKENLKQGRTASMKKNIDDLFDYWKNR